jgi:hypothetical protein
MVSNYIPILSNFDHSKKDLSKLEKFGIKYGFEDLEKMNYFIHRNIFRFEMDFKLKVWEIKVCFEFRKLIKIARNGLKIYKFSWR